MMSRLHSPLTTELKHGTRILFRVLRCAFESREAAVARVRCRKEQSPRPFTASSALVARVVRASDGAVYSEFLVAFVPVFFLFMCIWQLTEIFSTGLMVQHAATNAARSAGVVFADDPALYGGEPVGSPGPQRKKVVEDAALMTLAPGIADGTVREVRVDANGTLRANAPGVIDVVEVRVDVSYRCLVPMASFVICGTSGRRSISRGARHPYHGARYAY
jgi:hypothetical protein